MEDTLAVIIVIICIASVSHSGISVHGLLNDCSEKFILNKLISAIICLYFIIWIEAVLPLDRLVLIDSHEENLTLLSLQIVIDQLEEHHSLSMISIVLYDNSKVEKVSICQVELWSTCCLLGHINVIVKTESALGCDQGKFAAKPSFL